MCWSTPASARCASLSWRTACSISYGWNARSGSRTAASATGTATAAAATSSGDIFLGRVQRVLPAMQAAFINIGLERAGFLAAREARPRTAIFRDDPYTEDDRKLQIGDYVREGNEILVQVVKDPIGDKGARLSANVTIAGRLLILVANSPGVALSRRIDEEAERARLTGIVEKILAERPGDLAPGTGFILRTAAIGAGEAELKDDALQLAHVWRTITEKRVWAAPPAALHTDLGPIERALRDEVDGSINRVVIDGRTRVRDRARLCDARHARDGRTDRALRWARAAVRAFRHRGRDRGPLRAACRAALGRMDHHRGDRGADRDRRQFRKLYRRRRSRGHESEGEHRSGRGDRPAVSACAGSAG